MKRLLLGVCAVAACTAPAVVQAATQTSTTTSVETTARPVGVGEAPTVTRVTVRENTERPWAGPMSQLFWLDAETGIESVQLQTFSADFNSVSAGFLPMSGVGPTARIGAGLRFGFLTLGVRGRVATFEDGGTVGPWQIWTLDGELGVRVPLYRVEPHVAFAVGYSSFGGFADAVHGLQSGLDVHGVDGRLRGGVDVWLTHAISLGLDLDGELIAIARPGVSVRDLAVAKQVGTLDDAKARVLQANGSSVGSGVALTVGVGVHF